MNECIKSNSNGIMIPGSAKCSDLLATLSVIKKKLKVVLLPLPPEGKQGCSRGDCWWCFT